MKGKTMSNKTMTKPSALKLVTAESVRRGHPDKFCDQIADAILDAHLTQDPNARVGVEVFATAGKILIAGEVTSKAEVCYPKIVKHLIDEIGYDTADLCKEGTDELEIEVLIHDQSEDISQAVGGQAAVGSQAAVGDDNNSATETLGAGDQGIMVGYATDETKEYLPLAVVLAHRLCSELDAYRADWLGADGKVQVTVAYDGNTPLYVHTIVISVQHAPWKSVEEIRLELTCILLEQAIPSKLLHPETRILINPSGKFVLGGPAADTGLTGRKLAVDEYGPVAHIGGGALSGKDATKVDRSGAYMARHVAKNIVAAGLAKHCEVQLSYAIGRVKPVSVSIDTFGTSALPEAKLVKAVRHVFDLTPAGMIRTLELRKPIYAKTAVYGHFGKPGLPWERTDKTTELILTCCDMV